MSEAMKYKLPPLPDLLEKAISQFAKAVYYADTDERIGAANNLRKEIKAYAIAAIEAQGVSDGWQPTPENINALPKPVRRYIHDLVSNADPSGTVRDLTIAQDTIRELAFSNRLLRDACNEVVGCFDAAESEGLQEALANTTDERLKDLVERRLMYALYACQSLASAPPAPQAKPQPLSDERDKRIAELEERNRDLYEDVQRFKEHALNEKAARLELERQLEEARKQALEEAVLPTDPGARKAWSHYVAKEGAARQYFSRMMGAEGSKAVIVKRSEPQKGQA